MFGDLSKLVEMREKLNSVSPSFCLAKWKHVSLHLPTGQSHSCYLPLPHKVSVEAIGRDPSALHNTEKKKQMRHEMLSGSRPDECSICWKVEDANANDFSDRHFRGVDDWTLPFFDEVRNAPWDANTMPSYMEVTFGSACNFKCSYCSPAQSTEWLKEIKRFGSYNLVDARHHSLLMLDQDGEASLSKEENPFVRAFWRWWPKLAKNLMYFRITGGEPLLDQNTYKILDYLERNSSPRLNLILNSNLGVPAQFFRQFLDRAKKLLKTQSVRSIMLHTSLDTWGTQAEYLRNGLLLENFIKNLKQYLTELPESSIAVVATFNNLSLVSFKDFLVEILKLRREFNSCQRQILLDIPHLQTPEHQSVVILPERFQDLMGSILRFMQQNLNEQIGIKRGELLKIQRILNLMRQPQKREWLSTQRANFYLFFKEHDRRRGTSFNKAFPEMMDFWELCRAEAALILGSRKLLKEP